MIARSSEVFLDLALLVLLEPDELVVDRVEAVGLRSALRVLEPIERLREVVQRLVEVASVLLAGVLELSPDLIEIGVAHECRASRCSTISSLS